MTTKELLALVADWRRAAHQLRGDSEPMPSSAMRLDECADELEDALAGPLAQGWEAVPEHVRKLIGQIDRYRLCMSYNESYFGEPAGLLKSVFAELGHAANPIYPSGKTALYPGLPAAPAQPDGVATYQPNINSGEVDNATPPAQAAESRAEAARDFPATTCPASRHVQLIAERIKDGTFRPEPWMADSLFTVVAELWELRQSTAQAAETVERVAESLWEDGESDFRWEQVRSGFPVTAEKYLRQARAAIAAMRAGE